MARPSPNTGLRLPASAKADLKAILSTLKKQGEDPSQDDLVTVLLHRCHALIKNPVARDELAVEMRSAKAKRRK